MLCFCSVNTAVVLVFVQSTDSTVSDVDCVFSVILSGLEFMERAAFDAGAGWASVVTRSGDAAGFCNSCDAVWNKEPARLALVFLRIWQFSRYKLHFSLKY